LGYFHHNFSYGVNIWEDVAEKKQYCSVIDRIPEAAMLQQLFLTHPRSVGESYFAHQRVALSVGLSLFGAAMACLVHALVPALCEQTASRTIRRLNQRISSRASD
jgi:hypothetical protein